MLCCCHRVAVYESVGSSLPMIGDWRLAGGSEVGQAPEPQELISSSTLFYPPSFLHKTCLLIFKTKSLECQKYDIEMRSLWRLDFPRVVMRSGQQEFVFVICDFYVLSIMCCERYV